MNRLRYIILGVLVILIIMININTNKDNKTGVLINDYSYGIGRDDETGMTKVDFSIYVHNDTSNTVIVHSVKPVMEERLIELISGVDKIEVDDIILSPGDGYNIDGIIFFEQDGDKSFWVKEENGLVQSFIIDTDILVDRIRF